MKHPIVQTVEMVVVVVTAALTRNIPFLASSITTGSKSYYLNTHSTDTRTLLIALSHPVQIEQILMHLGTVGVEGI